MKIINACKRHFKSLFLSVLFCTLAIQLNAGHHFETELSRKYPQLDLTDIFVFKSKTPGKTVFIMAFNPKSQMGSLKNYSDSGIYRFNIGANTKFSKGLSPTFTFKNNMLQFYIADKAEPDIDVTGKFIGEGPINRQLELANGINIWTGTVHDLFQGNAKGIALFRENMNKDIFDLSVFNVGEAGNVFHNLLSTVIVLEMPNEMLPKKMYYYATTALEEGPNHWHRVNRIAHVLFPHTYLLDDRAKIKYMNSFHQEDADVREAIYDNVLKYVTFAGIQKNPKSYTNKLLKMIYPDVMTYTVGTDAIYTVDKVNGRPLQADAMDVALALLIGSKVPIDDHVSVNFERFQENFPFVVPVDKSYIDALDKVVKIN